MSYNSSIDVLLRYQKTRIPWRIFLALALFLCVASATGRWPMDVAEWCLDWGMALCMVVQFRLWDDLADVESDRRIHPGRVLCQTNSHSIFWALFGLLLIANAVLIAAFKSYPTLGVFFALNLSYFIWYSMPRKMTSDSVVIHSMLLVKYPVFVFLLSGLHSGERAGLPLVYGMLVTFLSFCSYELLHDQRLRANRNATSLLTFEFFAIMLVAILMLSELRSNASVLAIVHAGLLAAGSLILVYLVQQYRLHSASGLWHFGVFFVTFAWLLNFAMGNAKPYEPLRGNLPATLQFKTTVSTGPSI